MTSTQKHTWEELNQDISALATTDYSELTQNPSKMKAWLSERGWTFDELKNEMANHTKA